MVKSKGLAFGQSKYMVKSITLCCKPYTLIDQMPSLCFKPHTLNQAESGIKVCGLKQRVGIWSIKVYGLKHRFRIFLSDVGLQVSLTGIIRPIRILFYNFCAVI